MPKQAAHEAKDDAELQAWHDEAYAEYEKALKAFSKASDPKKPSALMDKKIRENYVEARDNLIAGVQYWRQVGEQLGTRLGVAIQEDTE